MIFSHAFLFTQAKEVRLVISKVPIIKDLGKICSGFCATQMLTARKT
jgi:hypothetical protein